MIEEAENKGKKEEKFEIAKSMLKDGLTKNTISKYTGLSIKEINKLKNY